MKIGNEVETKEEVKKILTKEEKMELALERFTRGLPIETELMMKGKSIGILRSPSQVALLNVDKEIYTMDGLLVDEVNIHAMELVMSATIVGYLERDFRKEQEGNIDTIESIRERRAYIMGNTNEHARSYINKKIKEFDDFVKEVFSPDNIENF